MSTMCNTTKVNSLLKSKSTEALNKVITEEPNEPPKPLRGRKSKYANDDERREARRQQQRAYRLRRKQEFESMKIMINDQANDIDVDNWNNVDEQVVESVSANPKD
ncbi:hypothetical protein M9Y10_017138 [Tritrichomonas musculus]|uniref:BZIP domain-containing protein n=1 Tax=Tritrichomonas musculus TaxID=1915356 RepID=A0ABR2HVK1_9EUKA